MALAAVAAALVLRWLMNPILGQQGPYLILTLALVLAALYGGFGPAVFATAVSTFIGTYLFIGSSPGSADVFQPANIGRTVLFVAIGLSISVIGGRLRTSRLALAASVRQLRTSNRAKDDALATFGHEIRNPLAALHSAHEVLKRAPDQPEKIGWVTGVIGRQLEQMSRMADELLDLSAISRGAVQIEHRPVDLQAVLRPVLDQARPLLEKKHHQLRLQLQPGPVMVLGDEGRLVQVFANLLNNAAKYTDSGGELVLAMRTGGAPAHVEVTVTDNGVGMDPASIPDLFEPFVQAPGASSNAEGGLGLGLAIVRKIVELHAGSVHADSAGPGQGSRFTVRLPLAS